MGVNLAQWPKENIDNGKGRDHKWKNAEKQKTKDKKNTNYTDKNPHLHSDSVLLRYCHFSGCFWHVGIYICVDFVSSLAFDCCCLFLLLIYSSPKLVVVGGKEGVNGDVICHENVVVHSQTCHGNV